MRGNVSKALEELRKKGNDDLSKMRQQNVKKNGQINSLDNIHRDTPNMGQIKNNRAALGQN